MWLLLVLVVCFSLMRWLLSLFVDGWLAQLGLFLCYFTISEYLHCIGQLTVPSARTSWLAHFVQRYAPVQYTEESVRRLWHLTLSGRQIMFCLAPHGPLCFSMAIGLAGHCGQMPAAISDRLAIIGHWSIRFIPIVRELSSIFGIISSARAPMDDALAAGQHLALIPCGMQAKLQTLIEEPGLENRIVVHRERHRMGFLSLAVRNNVLVVPVLAPEENHMYSLHGTSLRLWPLTLIVGHWLILPRCTLTLRIGAPLDPADFGSDVARLETAYYDALVKLAAPTHRIEFRYIG